MTRKLTLDSGTVDSPPLPPLPPDDDDDDDDDSGDKAKWPSSSARRVRTRN